MGARHPARLTILGGLLGSILILPASAQTDDGMSVCFPVRPVYTGTIGDFANYRYTARIRGTASADAEGYWIVAVGPVHDGWVQLGGSTRKNGATIDAGVSFGISNVSTYPLSFIVMKADGAPNFTYADYLAHGRGSNPVDLNRSDAAAHVVSAMDACRVQLVGEEPTPPTACMCPG